MSFQGLVRLGSNTETAHGPARSSSTEQALGRSTLTAATPHSVQIPRLELQPCSLAEQEVSPLDAAVY